MAVADGVFSKRRRLQPGDGSSAEERPQALGLKSPHPNPRAPVRVPQRQRRVKSLCLIQLSRSSTAEEARKSVGETLLDGKQHYELRVLISESRRKTRHRLIECLRGQLF